MRRFLISLCVAGFLAGCSTPNPNPAATTSAYAQVQCGMTHQQVFALLGPPRTVRPPGNVDRCQSATWSIPHDAHGVGHWTVYFIGDSVSSVNNAYAVMTLGYQRQCERAAAL